MPLKFDLSNQPDDDVARLRRELLGVFEDVSRGFDVAAACCEENGPPGGGGVSGWIQASDFQVDAGAPDSGPDITALLEAVSQGVHGDLRQVYIGPGDYTIATPVIHPENVRVWGAGPLTRFYQPVGNTNTVWDFQGINTQFLRSELAYCQIHGSGRSDPNDFSIRTGIGIDLAQVQQVILHRLEVWDFFRGIRVSNGVAFSSYHTIGPHIEVNRADIGIDVVDEGNNVRIIGSRVFFCYGSADTGIGINLSDPGACQIEGCAIEAADTCIRGRAPTGLFNASVSDSYLEPGTNPNTSTVGSAYDIVITDISDATATWREECNVVSALRGDVSLPPEGFFRTDGYSMAFYGARYNGASVPRRNYVFNGKLDMWALPDTLPGWANGGSPPTVAINLVDFQTGDKSMDVTAVATGSSIFAFFEVSDPGVEWITCGVRYRVPAGNTGFFFSGAVGANTRQSDTAADDDVWTTRWVTVPVDPTNRTGSITIVPDSVGGTGTVRIDEVFAVAGRYAMPSTQYGERVKLLPSPIPLVAATTAVNATWGPIDITTLPATLPGVLATLSTAPEGVVGCILRLRIEVDDGTGAGALGFPFYHFVNVPALGATTIAADIQRVVPTFSTLPEETTIVIRGTTLNGGVILGTGFDTDYEVDLIGWVLG